tara:strand:- start:991 stop:1200 length:210 start_codon:yes stop_codon:yes gene_type:complete
MLKCNSFRNKLLLKVMILRSHTNLINKNFKIKNVKIKTKPIIRYYFLSKQEKYDKIKAFNIIIKNFKNQ